MTSRPMVLVALVPALATAGCASERSFTRGFQATASITAGAIATAGGVYYLDEDRLTASRGAENPVGNLVLGTALLGVGVFLLATGSGRIYRMVVWPEAANAINPGACIDWLERRRRTPPGPERAGLDRERPTDCATPAEPPTSTGGR